jgi:hypothetical protein
MTDYFFLAKTFDHFWLLDWAIENFQLPKWVIKNLTIEFFGHNVPKTFWSLFKKFQSYNGPWFNLHYWSSNWGKKNYQKEFWLVFQKHSITTWNCFSIVSQKGFGHYRIMVIVVIEICFGCHKI